MSGRIDNGKTRYSASGVVIGEHRRHRSKRWIYGLALVIVLAAVIGTLWYVYRSKPTYSTNSNSAATTNDKQLNQLQDQSLYGDKNKALQAYDTAINAATDQTQKRNLLLDKAVAASRANQYSQGVEAAQAADAIKSDYRSLAILAMLYESEGDKAKAADYYTKAANDPSDFNVDKAEYRQAAAKLLGQS